MARSSTVVEAASCCLPPNWRHSHLHRSSCCQNRFPTRRWMLDLLLRPPEPYAMVEPAVIGRTESSMAKALDFQARPAQLAAGGSTRKWNLVSLPPLDTPWHLPLDSGGGSRPRQSAYTIHQASYAFEWLPGVLCFSSAKPWLWLGNSSPRRASCWETWQSRGFITSCHYSPGRLGKSAQRKHAASDSSRCTSWDGSELRLELVLTHPSECCIFTAR